VAISVMLVLSIGSTAVYSFTDWFSSISVLLGLTMSLMVTTIAGTLLPLGLIAVVAFAGFEGSGALLLLPALACLSTAIAGAILKFALVTRAGFNQGFALTQLPVRGTPQLAEGAGQDRPRMDSGKLPTMER